MRKKIFVSALMLMAALGIAKADVTQTLTINGQKVEKVVSQITFSGDNVVLHFNGSEESYPMNDVQIDFSGTDGINTVSTFTFNGIVDGQLNLAGLADGTPVAVYDISGKKVAATRAQSEATQLNVDNLNGGVYILKAGNQIVKFVKR